MTNWLRVLKDLLPRGRAWKLWPGSRIRAFFEGLLNGVAAPARDAIDETYLEIWPQTTGSLGRWETQWGLQPGSLTEQQRRDRLDAQWKALGGQSPRYIQDTLRGAGFDVYVHEWWEPEAYPPVARDPNLVLNVLNPVQVASVAGNPVMNAGNPRAYAGRLFQEPNPPGYPLVNIIESTEETIGGVAGNPVMNAGNPRAYAGQLARAAFRRRQYVIPDDSDYWPFFLYIGGENFPEVATVPESRRAEFETLCLKIGPAQQWLGILVEYV